MYKNIFITGITGQCGAMLANYLLNLDKYKIFGLIRRTSHSATERISNILNKINLIEGDLTDPFSLVKALRISNPDTIFNLGAQSFVKASWDQSLLTANVTGIGVLNLLESAKSVVPNAKFIQASSSEMYGLMKDENPLNEESKFYPRSPYSCAKVFGHYQTINFRESYNMWACCAIMFNYESELRSTEFVTRKITQAACRIKKGLQNEIRLGNIDSRRDWTYCADTCKALHLMMEMDDPGEYVIASGKDHSVRDFLQCAFSYLDLDYKKYLVIDDNFYRPAEVPRLLGNPSKIINKGWKPEVNFDQLVKIMVDADMKRLERIL